MKTLVFTVLAALFAAAGPAHALDLKLVPAGHAYVSTANARGYFDLVLDGVVVATDPREAVNVGSVRIDLLRGGVARETRMIGAEELVATTQDIATAGFDGAIQSQLLNRQGLEGLLGRPATLSSSGALGPSSALLLGSQYFATTFEPDALQVTVTYRKSNRRRDQTVSAPLPVVRYASSIVYQAPLSGSWYQSSLPSLLSHHRLNPSTAFALDFFKIDDHGAIFSGDRQDPSHYYGFGAPVLAAADGVVVNLVNDVMQDRSAVLPQPGETRQQASQRIGAYVQARMTADFRRAAAGNLIVIRHQSGNTIEYSAYGHLRTGSARVAVGQTVRHGEVIAEVGDTGDSPSVHLHFQVNANEDPFTSQSLPVQFANLPRFPDELGRIVTPSQ